MIHYISGSIISGDQTGLWIVAPQGASGIGYGVFVPERSEYLAGRTGQSVTLWIHTHVREDQLDLYGFATREEKELFLALTSVNGVGSKSALALLSAASPAQLVDAILSGDQDFLVNLPGVGAKTAARLVLELKKKLAQMSVPRAVSAAGESALQTRGTRQEMRDAREALLGLGFREADVSRLLSQWAERGELGDLSPEQLVRRALQEL